MSEAGAIAAIGPSIPAGWSWPAWAAQVRDTAARHGWPLRDVVVLLPHLDLLEPARRAWARHAGPGWLPRVETAATLAASLAPPMPPPPGAVQGDGVLDRLEAARLLGLGAAARVPARGAGAAPSAALAAQVPAVVDAAQAFTQALAAQAPEARAGWLARARSLIAAGTGERDGTSNAPGAQEAALLGLALEWAALHTQFATDALFALRPAAWVVLTAGGLDPLTRAVTDAAAAAGVPVERTDLDALDLESPASGTELGCAALGDAPAAPALAVCTSSEDEARRCTHELAAAAATANREGDAAPLALIAEDRLLVRRVRALLEARGVAIDDETGWKLATTRAAASVMAVLRAASPGGRSDDLLDALKACAAARADAAGTAAPLPEAALLPPAPRLVDRLEAWLRRGGWHRLPTALPDDADASLQALWRAWFEAMAPLAGLARAAPMPLGLALRRLGEALRACGLWQPLAEDAAGTRLIAELQLDRVAGDRAGDADRDPWARALQSHRVDLHGLTEWVDSVLEARHFRPAATGAASAAAGARVVITPLARALLRPWRAVVFPGLDERHFGAASATGLIDDGLARALGLPGAAEARHAQWATLRVLVRAAPACLLMRRRAEDGDPLAPSPWLERLATRLAAQARPVQARADGRARLRWAAAPVLPPGPVWRGAALWPAVVSAAGYERLRGCPYRFHVRDALRLREADELDDSLQAADVGDWLHRALHAFHAERAATGPRSVAADAERLTAIGRALLDDARRDTLDFLPDAADLPHLALAYAQWLAGEEAAGWQVAHTEHALRSTVADVAAATGAGPVADPAVAAVRLEGRIDRLDLGHAPGVPAAANGSQERPARVVDYKTTSKTDLVKRVGRPQEDTQLAFYAALLPSGEGAAGSAHQGVQAGYLSLRRGEVQWVPHADVADTAAGLVVQLVHDFERLRAGHPLRALGAEPACDTCESRGLCRRDHWGGTGAAADAT